MAGLTATTNANLPHRLADFETLTEGLDYAARGETGSNFFSSRGQLVESLTYGEIRERALDVAARFDTAGFERGERIALIAETTPDFLIFFYGCQYAGLIPVPLPLSINLGGHEAYVSRLRGMMVRAGVRAAVGSDELIDHLREAALGLDVDMVATPEEFYGLPVGQGAPRPLQKDEPCYIQYSSGSTSAPRGVLVTQRALTDNARGISRHGLALRPGDRSVSWLPLYHDMGLVGFCLTPVMSQISVDYLASTTFARRPLVWLKVLSEVGGTISFSPAFGYELCVRQAAKADLSGLDLSKWRVAGVGGEMVRPAVLSSFTEHYGACGFDDRAFLPSYGLAESTLAVTFSRLDEGVRIDHVSQDTYALSSMAMPMRPGTNGHARKTRSLVKCGAPLPGHRIEIRDKVNRSLPERAIGRVCIAGTSLMEGYFDDPEATRRAFTPDGWLDTGDLGYMVDGELVITGRSKDLIIFHGRNIWPQDIEWAIEQHCSIRSGDVAAFSVNGNGSAERVVVVVECRVSDPEEQHNLRRQTAAVVHRTAGVNCQVILAAPRTLTFTSSGKLSRSAAKEDFVTGVIEDIGADLPPPPPVLQESLMRASAGGK
jgi:fatty-acyl-CoA synthase